MNKFLMLSRNHPLYLNKTCSYVLDDSVNPPISVLSADARPAPFSAHAHPSPGGFFLEDVFLRPNGEKARKQRQNRTKSA